MISTAVSIIPPTSSCSSSGSSSSSGESGIGVTSPSSGVVPAAPVVWKVESGVVAGFVAV